MKLLYHVVPDNDGKTSKSTGLYGSVSKPCTPGEHQNSW